MEFRKDINGLRAIAVLSVMLFHFDLTGFTGGFVGVDIFFVISGFLMTMIIFKQLEEDRFSLISFYFSRGRRIVPALSALCLVLIIVNWFYEGVKDYDALGEYVVTSMTFVSNINYCLNINYFDQTQSGNFLLHTWSLSLEWQFYIIYPLLVLFLYKFLKNKKQVTVALFLTAAISLLLSIILSERYPSASFYLLPTRAWELILGGLVFLVPLKISHNIRVCIFYVGVFVILFSVVGFSENTIWPGWLACLPALGASCVVASSLNNQLLLNNIFSQWLGTISYSLYLWHWPIVVFFSKHDIFVNKNIEMFIGITLSVVFGIVSYLLIELPSKKYIKVKKLLNKKAYLDQPGLQKGLYTFAYLTPIALVISLGIFVTANSGFPSRFPIQEMTRDELMQERSRYWKESSEILSSRNHDYTRTTLLIGNSHAIDLGYALYENGFQKNILPITSTSYQCGNFGNLGIMDSESCEERTENWLQLLKSYDYDEIFITDHWPAIDLENLEDILLQIRKRTNVPIYVFGSKMSGVDVPKLVHKATLLNIKAPQDINKLGLHDSKEIIEKRISQNNQLLHFFRNTKWSDMSISYIDILNIQMDSNMYCEYVSNEDFTYMYFDSWHWTLQGARAFGEKLKNRHLELFF